MSEQFPRGIEVCVGALIRFNNKVLVIRSPKWQNKLAFPGGHVEPGETIMQAAEREAQEETGLAVQAVAITGWYESINPPQYHRDIHLLFYDVVCDAVSDELHLQAEEASEAMWLTQAELKTADLIDLDKPSIKRYETWLEQRHE